jgi:hypothetical protein
MYRCKAVPLEDIKRKKNTDENKEREREKEKEKEKEKENKEGFEQQLLVNNGDDSEVWVWFGLVWFVGLVWFGLVCWFG